MTQGKGDTPRPKAITDAEYAEAWTRTFCPPLRDPIYAPDPREAMRQRYLSEAKAVINGHPVVDALVKAVGANWVPCHDWPASENLPTTTEPE